MMCVTKGCPVKDHQKFKANWRRNLDVTSPSDHYLFILQQGATNAVFASYAVPFESVEKVWDRIAGDKRLMANWTAYFDQVVAGECDIDELLFCYEETQTTNHDQFSKLTVSPRKSSRLAKITSQGR